MAEKIRGITIEIGGDASGLEQSLKNVNKDLSSTQKQLKDVDRLLKLDPKNTELLAQKQKLLADQIKNTNEKLKTIKEAQETMDKNGIDKNSDQYMALEREIISTEREVKNLEAASEKTVAAMSKIGQAAEKVAKGAKAVAEKTKVLSAAAATGITTLAGLGIKAASDADELNTLAKQTGFSTDELQKFQYAADLVDVSMSDITSSATKLKKAMTSNNDEFKKLGISIKDNKGNYRNLSDVFYDTLSALSKIQNETERDAAAMAIFGKSADSLAGIIDDGGASLKAYGDEAEQLGLILDQKTLNSLNEVNDKLDKLKAQAKGRLAELGAKALEVITPLLEQLFSILDRILTAIGNLTPEQLKLIMTIGAAVAALSPLMSVISSLASAVALLPTLMATLGTAFGGLLGPIALVVAGIAALAAIIISNWDVIKVAFQNLMTWLSGVWESVKSVFYNIINFITGTFTSLWQRAWQGVKNVFSSIMSGLANAVKAPVNAIISMINSAISAINWLLSQVNKLGSVLGFRVGSIGKIPMMASGGVLSKGSAIVGEAGPELLSVSNGRATVTPLTNNSPAASQPIYITVQSVLDGKVISQNTTMYQQRSAKAYG